MWNMKQLEEKSDLNFAATILNERNNKLPNPYSPLSLKLTKASSYLCRLETQKQRKVTIIVFQGLVSEVVNLPEGFEYTVLDLDDDQADKRQDIEKAILDRIPNITQGQEYDNLVESVKDYLERYPVKDRAEFLIDMLNHNINEVKKDGI